MSTTNYTETPAASKAASTAMSAPTSSSSSTSSSLPVKKGNGPVRLPTLNQLAARINSNAGKEPPQANTTSAPRPRLATSVLRGAGSTTSVNTATSTADSMAVNVSSTRSTSPAISNASTATSNAQGDAPSGGEPLTEEKLEILNQETGSGDTTVKTVAHVATEAPRKKVGYKNIPSLDAITNHLKTKLASQISVDGSVEPPEVEMIEDPKTPGVPIKPPEHPLQFPWTIYHDTKAKYPYTPATAAVGSGFNQPAPGTNSQEPPVSALHPPEGAEYEAGLTIIGEFDTVEEFCRYFNWLKPPSKLEKNSNYHIFKSGIKPMWEDPANANGGKWVLTMKNNATLLDRCWSWLAMALVGEELEDNDEICGAVVSLRSKVDRIQVWTRSKDDVEKLNAIAKRLVKLLDVSEADGIGLEFQYNSDDRPPPNKFISIQSAPMSSFRGSFQGPPGTTGHSSTRSFGGSTDVSGLPAGSAFGSFGTGVGIGGQTWKAGVKRT